MKKKVFVITGEASGDMLASKLLRVFEQKNPDIEFYGVGGDALSNCSNFNKMFDIKLFSIMGFFEVIKNLRTLQRRMNDVIQTIVQMKPDLILSVDASSLSKYIVSKIRKYEAKGAFYGHCNCVHYVAPQVWAWKEKRAKSFANLFDKILCFFDFEPKYFLKYNDKISCPVIGYTPMDGLKGNPEAFRVRHNISDDNIIISLLPGSRKNEVDSMLSTYKSVAKRLKDKYQNVVFVIPTISFLKDYIVEAVSKWDVDCRPLIIDGIQDRYDLFSASYIALSVSGTVVSELSFFNVPTIVNYRFNPFTMFLVKMFIKVKYASIFNIVNDRMIQTELLHEDANAEKIFKYADDLLKDKELYSLSKQEIAHGLKKFVLNAEKSPSELAYDELMQYLSL